MKRLILPVFAVSAFLLSSCSTTQLARQADSSDDVYYTEAKAKIITPVVYNEVNKQEQTYRTDEQLYGDEQYADNRFEDDYSYSARINRFYYNSPYRPYYDYRYSYGYNPWYTYSYDPFFYDPWLYRPGISLWVGVGRYPRWNNYHYGYYGGGYNNGYWGPYSYYNTYPGYGYGGYYGGGYYGGNYRDNNPNYRARPNRGGSEYYGNGSSGNRSGGTIVTGGDRRGSAPGRNDGRVSSDNSQPASNTRPRPTPERSTRDRRDDGATTSTSRPAPVERPARAERPTERYTPPPSTRETYSPPPSNSGRSSSGSSDGGSRGSSGGGRPSRGGN